MAVRGGGGPTGPVRRGTLLASLAGVLAFVRRVTDRFPSLSVTVSTDVGKRLGSALKKRYVSLQDFNDQPEKRCSALVPARRPAPTTQKRSDLARSRSAEGQ